MKIKGLVLHARKEFVVVNFGEVAWGRVLDALPKDDREVLSQTILTASWYSFEIGMRLDQVIVDVLGEGNEKIFEEIGARSARRGLTKVHKSFLTPGDPQSFMKKAPVIYKFYYDTGYREYKETGPSSGVMTTYEAETFSRPDCLTIIGWYKEALRMCGAVQVVVTEEECRALGDPYCRYHFQWKV
ncbi:MAG: TIGR02265 family protein [bacterium]|nr:MAG: TIGR02265 family protein [bacterium]